MFKIRLPRMGDEGSIVPKVAGTIGVLALAVLGLATAASATDTDYATVTGHEAFSSNANNASYWGDNCTDIEPGGSAYTLGAGTYSKVIVKAGSGNNANTIFGEPPTAGQTVWADTNGDGIYNPGGQDGDKDISHVILCETAPSPIKVTPSVVTTDLCGLDNATIEPVEQKGVIWSAGETDPDGTMWFVAQPVENYTFGDAQFEFSMKDSGELCPVEPPVLLDDPTVSITCSAVTIVNPNDSSLFATIIEPDAFTDGIEIAGGTSLVLPFPEYNVSELYIYVGETDYYQNAEVQYPADCEVPDPDPIKVTPSVVTTDLCGLDNATIEPVEQKGVIWSAGETDPDGTMWFVAQPVENYTFGDAQFEFSMKDSGELCPPNTTEVTPVAPTVTPVCGADNDTVTIPTTEGVKYVSSGWKDGKLTVTASAVGENVVLTGTSTWTFTDANVACGGNTPKGGATGLDGTTSNPWTSVSVVSGLGALAIAIAGGGLGLYRRFNS